MTLLFRLAFRAFFFTRTLHCKSFLNKDFLGLFADELLRRMTFSNNIYPFQMPYPRL